MISLLMLQEKRPQRQVPPDAFGKPNAISGNAGQKSKKSLSKVKLLTVSQWLW